MESGVGSYGEEGNERGEGGQRGGGGRVEYAVCEVFWVEGDIVGDTLVPMLNLGSSMLNSFLCCDSSKSDSKDPCT